MNLSFIILKDLLALKYGFISIIQKITNGLKGILFLIEIMQENNIVIQRKNNTSMRFFTQYHFNRLASMYTCNRFYYFHFIFKYYAYYIINLSTHLHNCIWK